MTWLCFKDKQWQNREVHFKHEPKRFEGKTVIKNGMETEGGEALGRQRQIDRLC
jgi:hypothetical protein